MARLQLDGLTKRYGDFHATRDVSLTVEEGEFVVLLGPSGCGKTTTLRMVAGFVEPTAGRVFIGGQDITGLPPWKRNTGLVFQSYALFPHMTVGQNVAFGLEMRRVGRAECAERVAEALRLVRLEHLADRLPRQLSGGQQQRVALARALVFRPDILLLDEPLSNLDAKLREEVRVEIRGLQRELGITTVMVTHDQEEALTIADRLVVMNEGRVQQIGDQRALYERPRNRFVAGFVGRGSFLDGVIEAPGRFRSAGGLAIACAGGSPGPAVLGLRPERVRVGDCGGKNAFPARVEFVSYLGGLIELHCRLSPRDRLIAQMVNDGSEALPRVGDSLTVSWAPEAAFVFPGSAEG
ncbi:MAG: spermidine/putrescine ABC transporter ATPase [Paracoccaceae bacterium]|nr:MAG: spermidine/putrescine ABC transporter ATPase [Paracoccaceae bacterium]